MNVSFSKSRMPVLLMAAVVLAGCDDDEPVTAITAEQAEALTVTVWEQAYAVGSGIPVGFSAAGLPPIAAQAADYEDETTLSCELSGSVTVQTTAFIQEDPGGESGTLSVVGVKTHSNCTLQAEDFIFTLDGAPAITTAWDFTVDAESNVTFDGSMTGGVDVTSEDGTGFCAFDVDWGGANTSQGTFTFELAGTVCGRQVSRSLSVNTAT